MSNSDSSLCDLEDKQKNRQTATGPRLKSFESNCFSQSVASRDTYSKHLKMKQKIRQTATGPRSVASLELKIDGCNLCPITVIRHNLHKIAQN